MCQNLREISIHAKNRTYMNWKPPQVECGGNIEHIRYQKSHISRFSTAVFYGCHHIHRKLHSFIHMRKIWHGKMLRLKDKFIHKWKFTPMMTAITKKFWYNIVIIFSVNRSLLTLMMFLFSCVLHFLNYILSNPFHGVPLSYSFGTSLIKHTWTS